MGLHGHVCIRACIRRSAGNRTAYTRTITSTEAALYTYDAANRLATLNGQPILAWDANGNLLADGSTPYATTYGYDQANWLITTTIGSLHTGYAYNGDGARLAQYWWAGTTPIYVTTYTLDLAAPLVQVLIQHAGLTRTRYLYGLARLGEQASDTWAYHLTDGLGSVRQLAGRDGLVTLARGYTPYGEDWWSEGCHTRVCAACAACCPCSACRSIAVISLRNPSNHGRNALVDRTLSASTSAPFTGRDLSKQTWRETELSRFRAFLGTVAPARATPLDRAPAAGAVARGRTPAS